MRKITGPIFDQETLEWRIRHNWEIRDRTQQPHISQVVKSRRIQLAGHIARIEYIRIPKQILTTEVMGRRPLGRPRKDWNRCLREDLNSEGIEMDAWMDLAQEREGWRRLTVLSLFYTGFWFSSLSYLCLFGFVPVLFLPRLPILCLDVGSSGCVSSYGFVVGGSSYFLFLCFGCFLLNFFWGFTSCFRFLVIFSCQGFAAVWLCRLGTSFNDFTCLIITPCWSLLLQLGVSTLQGWGGVLALRRLITS